MIVGTAGHIDHGKTSLVKKLTGIDTDRLKEEKKRGISIDLGFAYLPASDGAIVGFIDVPGHEKFVHNMLAGATGIDYVLFAIAADDSVMPQTREHLSIVDLLGISNGVVAITKSDLVSSERLLEVQYEIRQALSSTGLADIDVLPVSSQTGEGIDRLRKILFMEAARLPRRSTTGRFRLAVDRSFTLQGIGTVVTGTVMSGVVNVGDVVTISPSGLKARVRTIHTQKQASRTGSAGDRCALNLVGDGIGKEAISRGDVVLDPELHAPTNRIDSTLRVLASKVKPVTQWMPVLLHHAATEVSARISLLRDVSVAPGEETFVQLVLDKPIAAAVGDRFVLRDSSAQRTFGGGKFLDLRAPARKRGTPERMEQLRAHSTTDNRLALAALLETAPGYVDFSAFVRDRALSSSECVKLADIFSLIRLVTPKGELALSPINWFRLKQSILLVLDNFHKKFPDLIGIGLEKLRSEILPRLPAPAFLSMLQELTRSKEVTLDSTWVRLPGHEVRLSPRYMAIWEKAQRMIGGAERFRPPRVRDIARSLQFQEADVRQLFKSLSRMGHVEEVAHDHFFLRGTLSEIGTISISIADENTDSQFTASQLRDRLNNGRKVTIQILEFFDRHGITSRRGDSRKINKHRLDLYRRSTGEAETPSTPISGRATSPVGRPDFKSGKGRKTVLGGFDSHSLPPNSRGKVR